jgi:hypothetical protein
VADFAQFGESSGGRTAGQVAGGRPNVDGQPANRTQPVVTWFGLRVKRRILQRGSSDHDLRWARCNFGRDSHKLGREGGGGRAIWRFGGGHPAGRSDRHQRQPKTKPLPDND